MNLKLIQEAIDVSNVINRRIQMQIPSILAQGEEFALRISITGSNSLPVYDFSETIEFAGSVGVEGLPPSIKLAPGAGTARIEKLQATGPEAVLIKAQVKTPELTGSQAAIVSNPAWVYKDPPYRIYWGDLHVHTRLSNCHGWRCLDPEWCYLYARDISLLDFVAPADHLRGIASDPARWPRLQEHARQFNSPHEFVTFLAYESSHAQGFGGDNNVYFLDEDAPHFWIDREDMHGYAPKVHLTQLWQQMDDTGRAYFSVPHHTGRAAKYRSWNEQYHDPVREPLFEIYSSWGSSEMRHSRFPISGGNNDDVSYFVDALKAGARFGLIASSDDHATLPGSVHHFRNEPHTVPMLNGHAHKGLAAVRCSELTRDSLFQAMKQRNVYATTHARSLVEMHIGDATMGQQVAADDSLKRRREVSVRLMLHESSRAKITLMRNGEALEVKSLGGVSDSPGKVIFEDKDDFDAIALRETRFHPQPFVVYYARIEDTNGAHQWTSPIWID